MVVDGCGWLWVVAYFSVADCGTAILKNFSHWLLDLIKR